ncbi:hypothetical protein BpHYR1_015100 [Brachionus plicatilis]|uniref:Uncharacterized protein n=1 Tax=Brachionus plicatilis TaxID=10195 RepID=A0A3M7RN61_BRAPC|nr:hypothetical protein BpHYR1_015100 [Brachionus plicatilis]
MTSAKLLRIHFTQGFLMNLLFVNLLTDPSFISVDFFFYRFNKQVLFECVLGKLFREHKKDEKKFK